MKEYVFMFKPTGELAIVSRGKTENGDRIVEWRVKLDLVLAYKREPDWMFLGPL